MKYPEAWLLYKSGKTYRHCVESMENKGMQQPYIDNILEDAFSAAWRFRLPFVVTVIKQTLSQKGYLNAMDFYEWCIENNIKVSEPKNKKTEIYDKFIVELDTEKKAQLFAERYPEFFVI